MESVVICQHQENPIQELIYMWARKKFKADGMIMKGELFVTEITIIRIRIIIMNFRMIIIGLG